ncbi:hemolysin family protein [Cohnella fermenti]|uniref:HlyC/CorC family transporter n=1 Tax=Cohnella fermenti TaxID=2565925 RepID=A0A4S4BWF8_9BACL|nr:hemolysin family protein [Cohnella fermenti]THF79513.1 HlyC/CorC family transporter [Cohnella fermenti]
MGLNLLLVALLIVLTAFFVATEFAIVKLRSSRVDQLVLEGKKNALAVRKVTSNLDAYLSACQLGITITALGLGWLGEPTIEKLLHPLFNALALSESASHVISFAVAFVVMTYLHVVLGELAPKTAAIVKAEQVALFTAPIIIYFYKIMYPFIWALNGSARGFVKLFGMQPVKEHEEAHSEDEIRIILSESYESGKINKTEYGYVNRIFTFDELLAREIMVPRTDMVCLYTDKTVEENRSIIKREQYTRFPVAQGDKDHIVGVLNTKRFFLSYDNDPNFDYRSLIQPIMAVPDAMPVKTLLRKMQQENVHLAILLDEYGGTSGLITIEDILEEIVGEIRDEFDKDEGREIEPLGDNRYLVEGTALIEEVNRVVGTRIEDEDVDSIGGWLYNHEPELPVGTARRYGNVTFIIREKGQHRVRKIEIAIDDESH